MSEVTKLLNVHEVAQALGLSESATYRLIKSGAIKTTRIGRAIRVSVAQLNTFIDNSVENSIKRSGITTEVIWQLFSVSKYPHRHSGVSSSSVS